MAAAAGAYALFGRVAGQSTLAGAVATHKAALAGVDSARKVLDETVLVADFGGGTSDFCLVRLGPGREVLGLTGKQVQKKA